MNLTDRFKRNHSEAPPAGKWARSLLSRQGERELYGSSKLMQLINASARCPVQWLSRVGQELYTIVTLVKDSDPVRPMAMKALTEGCVLSYAALLDALEEDGVLTDNEAVPSRFAALLLQNGLTGVEVDRVLDDWGDTAKGYAPHKVARMRKALAQGVIVYETTFTPGPGAAVVRTEKHKAVRVKPARRVTA